MHVKQVRYNPASGAFEGRVDIVRDGVTYRYPCEVPGPMTMDFARVVKGLCHQARRMSDTGAAVRSYN